jgi:hypothetical protein
MVEEYAKQETSKKQVGNLSACHLLLTGFLLGLLFDPEDGDDMFLRRVGIFPNYAALRPQRHILHTNIVKNKKLCGKHMAVFVFILTLQTNSRFAIL